MTVEQAVDAFHGDLALGRSPRTISTYRAALRRFLVYLELYVESPETLPALSLSIDQAIDFARWIGRSDRGLPKRTLFTYTTAVARFYAFLVREDIAPALPLEKLQLRLRSLRGRRPAGLPRVPSTEAIEAILEAARRVPAAGDERTECLRLRNIALVEVLRGSGLRVSELVALRRGDLNRAERTAIVTGKGSKARLVYFTPAAWRALEAYFAARHDGAGTRALATLPVFARHDPGAGREVRPLSTNTVRRVIEDLARAAGLGDLVLTPHRFRAWFATHLVERTGDLAAVQDLLGHESANTTRIYTKVAAGRLRAVHQRAFGRPVNEPPASTDVT